MNVVRKPLVWMICLALATGASVSALDADVEDAVRSLIEAAESGNNEARIYSWKALPRVGRPCVEPLTELLRHPSVRVREYAAGALGSLREEAVESIPDLVATLADQEPVVRGRAALALGDIAREPEVCVPALLSALGDEAEWPRRFSARALSRFETQGEEIVRRLTEALASEDTKMRRGAAAGLGPFASKFDEVVPLLMDALDDPEQGVRLAALHALREAGKKRRPAVPVFLRMMKEDVPDIRREAALVLSVARVTRGGKATSSFEPRVIAALLGAMKEDEEVCGAAAGVLGNMGPCGHQALVEALSSDTPHARLWAARICAYRSDLSRLARPLLVEALRDENRELRWYAAMGLAQTKDAPDAAVAILRDMLDHRGEEHTRLREHVVWVSGRLGRAGIPCLAFATSDPALNVRKTAIHHLGRLKEGSEEAVPLLIAALEDPDSSARLAAVEALGSKEAEAPSALPALETSLRDEEPRVQLAAANLLVRLDAGSAHEAAVAALVALLNADDAYVRQSAASTLAHAERHVDAVMPVLVEGLRHRARAGDTASDILAAQTLAAVGPRVAEDEETLMLLARMLEDRDSDARITAIKALGMIAPEREWLIAALVKTLGSSDVNERAAAIEALARIGPGAKAAVPALDEISKTDIRLRVSAQWALDIILAEDLERFRSELDPRVVSMLLGLGSDDADEGRLASNTLTSMGQEALPDIIRALSDEKYRLRDRASFALTWIDPDVAGTDDAVPHLVEMLNNSRANFRCSATAALGNIGGEPSVLLPALIKAARDDDPHVVKQAAMALRKMRREAKPAVPSLVEALRHENASHAVARTLCDMGVDPAHVPTLIRILREGKPEDRYGSRASATRVLCQMGPAAKDGVDDLVSMLRNSDEDLRYHAARVLGAIGLAAAEAVPDLQRIATDNQEEWRVRVVCASAWKCAYPEADEAIPIIQQALAAEQVEVRYDAVVALAAIRPMPEEGVRLLAKALKDADPSIREKAIQALRFSGGDVSPVLPAIREAVSGPQDQVYWNARAILKGLGEPVPDQNN